MKSRHLQVIAKKEFSSLVSEKTIILAIILQLFIAMFSSFLLVGLASMYNPDAISQYVKIQYPIAYSGSHTPVLQYLEEDGDFIVYEMPLSDAVGALKERKLSAVIWVPDTPEYADEPVKITIYTVQNDIQSSIVNVKLKDTFIEYEERLREVRSDRIENQPVDLNLPPSNPSADFYEFVYGLLIPLLVFMPAIISGALIIDLITEEYQHDTLETLMSTPLTFPEAVWGKILACFIIVPLQATGWLILLILNGIRISGVVPIILHVSAGSMVIILLGALTALRYRERTNAQFVFSTALVVVIIASLAFPMNPANLIVRLSVNSIGHEHWLILAVVIFVAALLGILTTKYAERVRDIAIK
ncbi:MAG: ABC transporter permease [Methanomicrobiaceae archaeon]|nr:ABC transporter permease [Methanomicrobiaceae archaeon]